MYNTLILFFFFFFGLKHSIDKDWCLFQCNSVMLPVTALLQSCTHACFLFHTCTAHMLFTLKPKTSIKKRIKKESLSLFLLLFLYLGLSVSYIAKVISPLHRHPHYLRPLMCIYQHTIRECSFFSLLKIEQMLIGSAIQLLNLVVKYNMKMH